MDTKPLFISVPFCAPAEKAPAEWRILQWSAAPQEAGGDEKRAPADDADTEDGKTDLPPEGRWPFAVLADFLRSPVAEESAEYIEAIMALAEKSAVVDEEARVLMEVLDDQEKLRLALLQKEMKNGLSAEELPYGTSVHAVTPVPAAILRIEPLSAALEALQDRLRDIAGFDGRSAGDLEQLKTLKRGAREAIAQVEALGNEPRYALTDTELRRGWQKLFFQEASVFTSHEVEVIATIMKNAAVLQRGLLQKREEYYASFKREGTTELDPPNMAPLAEEVRKLNRFLEGRLELLPQAMNAEQRGHLQAFLPMLDEYYKDQVCAFSGGNAYLKLDAKLQALQGQIDADRNVGAIMAASAELGDTMQRLYVLHWLAESVMKKALQNTLTAGRNVAVLLQQCRPENRQVYKALQKAIFFRNDVAHNGRIWGPEDFKTNTQAYHTALETLQREFEMDYATLSPSRLNRPMSPDERRERNRRYLYEGYQVEYELAAAVMNKKQLEKAIDDAANGHTKQLDKQLEGYRQFEEALQGAFKVDCAAAAVRLGEDMPDFAGKVRKMIAAPDEEKGRWKAQARNVYRRHFARAEFGISFKEAQRRFGRHQIISTRHYEGKDPDSEADCRSAAGMLHHLCEAYFHGKSLEKLDYVKEVLDAE